MNYYMLQYNSIIYCIVLYDAKKIFSLISLTNFFGLLILKMSLEKSNILQESKLPRDLEQILPCEHKYCGVDFFIKYRIEKKIEKHLM